MMDYNCSNHAHCGVKLHQIRARHKSCLTLGSWDYSEVSGTLQRALSIKNLFRIDTLLLKETFQDIVPIGVCSTIKLMIWLISWWTQSYDINHTLSIVRCVLFFYSSFLVKRVRCSIRVIYLVSSYINRGHVFWAILIFNRWALLWSFIKLIHEWVNRRVGSKWIRLSTRSIG